MARKKNIILRVNDNEHKAIKENADKAQLTVSEYLRLLGLYGKIN